MSPKGHYEHPTRHGHGREGRQSSTYRAWVNMRARCQNKENPYYGGKGIDFDPRWKEFDNFLCDMGEKPTGFFLDRIDNNRGYWPGNCRWVPFKTHYFNRGRKKYPIDPYPDNSEPGD